MKKSKQKERSYEQSPQKTVVNEATNEEVWKLDPNRNWDKTFEEHPEFWQNAFERENNRPIDGEAIPLLEKDNDEALRDEFLRAVREMPASRLAHAMAAAMDSAYGLPPEAPVLWENRKPKQNLFDFIRESYGPWIGKGLRRSHLSQLDRRLYNTLSVRLKRDPDCLPEDLATLEGRGEAYTQESLSQLGIHEPKDAFRIFADDQKEANRAYSAAVRHLK